MSTVTVCLPWIDTGCPWRRKSRDWTLNYWADQNVNISSGHTEPTYPLNRAKARNDVSRGVTSDVLFFCDADMWVTPEAFWSAVELAAESNVMVLAYVQHLRLNKWSTEHVYKGTTVLQGSFAPGCIGGAFAVSRSLLEAVGGHDERFTAWGGEDRAFEYACRTLAGPTRRIPGTSWHLWHPRGADQARITPERRAGLELAKRYKQAAGHVPAAGILKRTSSKNPDPEAMRAILSEHGGPLASWFHESSA